MGRQKQSLLTDEQRDLRLKAIAKIEAIEQKTYAKNPYSSQLWLIAQCLELLKKPFRVEIAHEKAVLAPEVHRTSYSHCNSPAPKGPLMAEIALKTGELSPRLSRGKEEASPRSGAWIPEESAVKKNGSFAGRAQHSRSFSDGNAKR